MNHAKNMLAITAIVTAAALASVAFAAPQVMAHRYNHHNNHNGIKVDQQVNQANVCSGSAPPPPPPPFAATNATTAQQVLSTSPGSTACINLGANSADIGH